MRLEITSRAWAMEGFTDQLKEFGLYPKYSWGSAVSLKSCGNRLRFTFWKDGCGLGKRKDQGRGKGGSRKTGREAPAVSQARAVGILRATELGVPLRSGG